jgi:hypothetical protein
MSGSYRPYDDHGNNHMNIIYTVTNYFFLLEDFFNLLPPVVFLTFF